MSEQVRLERHPIFSKVFPLLSEEKFSALESDCVARGIVAPLFGWKHEGKNWCIDGYNRLTIADKHNLPYDVKWMEFDSEKDAEKWIRLNQGNRRNLGVIQNMSNIAEVAALNGDDHQTATDLAVSMKTVQKAKKVKKKLDMMPNQLVLDILWEKKPCTIKDITKLSDDEDELYEQIDYFKNGLCETLKQSIERSKPTERGQASDKDKIYIKTWALSKGDSNKAYLESDKDIVKVNASNYLKRPEILKGIIEWWITYPPGDEDGGIWVKETVSKYTSFKEKYEYDVFDCYYDLVLEVYNKTEIAEVIEVLCDGFLFFQQFKRNFFADAFQRSIKHQFNRLSKLQENPQFATMMRYVKGRTDVMSIMEENIHITNKST